MVSSHTAVKRGGEFVVVFLQTTENTVEQKLHFLFCLFTVEREAATENTEWMNVTGWYPSCRREAPNDVKRGENISSPSLYT